MSKPEDVIGQNAADVRAVAVAKLKRAASLPRMKDGRRPAMHTEGVSEGEKSALGTPIPEEGLGKISQVQPPLSPERTDNESQPSAIQTPSPLLSPGEDAGQNMEPAKNISAKRRSRSRSRSRGSKDLRKMKPLLSPSQPQGQLIPPRSEESSQEEELSALPSFDRPPATTSPLRFSPRHQNLRNFMNPSSPQFFPGYMPVSPPSLEVLQARLGAGGLNRSNSAAARLMAMHKLTGGTEPPDQSLFAGPVVPLSPAFLTRNNTVSGGERADRSIARNALFRKLGGRRNADGEQTSGGEDVVLPAKRQRRRSRRRSAGSSTIVDDRDPPTSSNTPLVTEAPLPPYSFPIPPIPQDRRPSPSPSHASSQTASARRHSLERNRDSALAKLTGENQFEYEIPLRSNQRRVVVEEDPEDEPAERPIESSGLLTPRKESLGAYASLLPPRPESAKPETRLPHSSEAPSAISTDSVGSVSNRVPLFLSDDPFRSPGKQDVFPTSPWNTPMKERLTAEDEEEVVYQDDTRSRRVAQADNIVSWVDAEVETRMPIDDGTDEEERTEQTGNGDVQETEQIELPLGEIEAALAPSHEQGPTTLLYGPEMKDPDTIESLGSNVAFSQATTTTVTTGNEADESSSSDFASGYLEADQPPTPAPVDTPYDLSDWEQIHTQYDVKRKPSRDDMSPNGNNTKWDTVKRVLTGRGSRAPSVTGSAGRHSRSNSVANRKDVESAASRESASSIASGKTESRNERHSHQAQLSASESILSLAAPVPPRGGVSPIPPASTSDLKYMDSKLYPFPGIVTLQKESERKKARGMSLSASTPDITSIPSSSDRSTHTMTPQLDRDRKLSSQASDSRLQIKYQQQAVDGPPSLSRSQVTNMPDYFHVGGPGNAPRSPHLKIGKLPMDRQGVKHWLKKFVPSPTGLPPSGTGSSASGSRMSDRNQPSKKPSLSDVLLSRKEGDTGTDWEELAFPGSPSKEVSKVWDLHPQTTLSYEDKHPTKPKFSSLAAIERHDAKADTKPPRSPTLRSLQLSRMNATSQFPSIQSTSNATVNFPPSRMTPLAPFKPLTQNASTSGTLNSQIEPPSPSTEPSPSPSVSLTPSTSSFISSTSSPSSSSNSYPVKPTELLKRVNAILTDKNNLDEFLPEPPRKLVYSSSVLQIIDSNTAKQRVLLLFSDLLVLAKFVTAEPTSQDSGAVNMDAPLIIKNIAQLRSAQIKLTRGSQNDVTTLQEYPLVQRFVQDFKFNPDRAVSLLMQDKEDPAALSCILFTARNLDRAQLGSYLARRSSKIVLKSFIDQFGFAGVRIDQALRVFWLSIRAPASQGAMDNLLSGFASRWFEANSQLVSFDRDLAIRLVGAIMQLNQALYPESYSHESYVTPVQVSAREFCEAFRPYDSRHLVSDEMLEHIHTSIQGERLASALDSSTDFPMVQIILKQKIPLRLIYRVESEPIVVRIPRPDSNLTIRLIGQGLLFNPPILEFSKSAEASFRVTGTALGTKSMIMSRAGPHAPYYTGLPLSKAMIVERAFMRNVFQLSLTSTAESTRSYMFSVEENQTYLAAQLERQISEASGAHYISQSNNSISDKVRRASDIIAYQVLKDSLLTVPTAPLSGHLLQRPLHQQQPVYRTGREVALLCRQNSLLPFVLSHVAGHQEEMHE